MDVHGTMNAIGGVVFAQETNFPAVPVPGRTCFKDGTLYFCVSTANGLPVWIPLTKTLEMLRFDISTPALEWTLPHNLNTNALFVQIYDSTGQWVLPDRINIAVAGQVTVSFGIPMSGIAILQRGATEGVAPEVIKYSANFSNSAVWVVNHNLGFNPIVKCIVGGNEVQPASIVYNSTMQLTVTFNAAETGSVRCI